MMRRKAGERLYSRTPGSKIFIKSVTMYGYYLNTGEWVHDLKGHNIDIYNYIYDLFYTEKEIRKMKLEQICSK